MATDKKEEKTRLHSRNKNRARYDLKALIKAKPALAKYVKPNKFGDESVDFSNPDAVRMLNTALLYHYYGIEYWDFPQENLCPAIPGRADYIHYIADLLGEYDRVPTGENIKCFDVGMGASCIYPIIGVTEYGWGFVASDVDKKSIDSAKEIIERNAALKGKVEVKFQGLKDEIFFGIIGREDKMDLAICNPPFHSSKKEALSGSRRKVRNLTGKRMENPSLNFSGMTNELIFEGGELQFIKNMIRESVKFSQNFYWFSTLVSKQANLKSIYTLFDNFKAKQVKTIPMGTGNKSTRIVAWTFLTKEEQAKWREERWSSENPFKFQLIK